VTAALHDLDPVFREFTRSEAVANLLMAIGCVKPVPVQSMYIFKVADHTRDARHARMLLCGEQGPAAAE
jgi:hypothetical protein